MEEYSAKLLKKKITENMPKRLRYIIEVKGYLTKY